MQGTVVAVHSGGLYRVQCDAGHEVLAQLSGLLTDEQRDDLRAALERRPLVKQPQAQPQPVVFKVKQIAKLDEFRAIDAGSVSDEQLQLQLRKVQETLLTR